ncbi:hypothetical protein [Streptomyces sp. P9-A4]|uniref:hypothetical protein n=1 Tax=Streptomyces sp. P9-A4 TaxID=3072285 RepID=UPI002FCC29D6
MAAALGAAPPGGDDPLQAALGRLVPGDRRRSFGADIDAAHEVLLSTASRERKEAELLRWFGRSQPCVFAKVTARAAAHPALDVCWIDEADLERGAHHVRERLQRARTAWKRRAAAGLTSSLQVMFNSEVLAYAEPGPELVEVLLMLTGLYLPEWAPVEADTICLDGIPLRRPGGRLELYAASMTTFFTGAHLTRAHDHRVPGGVLLNVNAVGHHTQAAYDAGQFDCPAAAVERSHQTALRSVGNGGIGHPDGRSSTWHLRKGQPGGQGQSGPRRPGYVPPDADPERYGSQYHIDVTVSSQYADPGPCPPPVPPAEPEEWTMMLDYFTAEETPGYHNPALMRGLPITPGQAGDAPWKPDSRPGDRREF